MVLNFRLRKVIDYARQRPDFDRMRVAEDFFGKKLTERLLESEIANALFNEWLIFDHKDKTGITPIAESFLKNPDNLSKKQLDQLEQVIKTQRYEVMEIVKIIRGKGLFARLVRTGERFFVDDLAGSHSASVPSLFFNRLASIEGKWVLVGCDNVSFSRRLSPKEREEFARILNKEKTTPKLVIDVFGDRF